VHDASYIIIVIREDSYAPDRVGDILETIWNAHGLLGGANVTFVFPRHPTITDRRSFRPIKTAIEESGFDQVRLPFNHRSLAGSPAASLYVGHLVHQFVTNKLLSGHPAYRTVGRPYLRSNIFRIYETLGGDYDNQPFRWDHNPSPQLKQLMTELCSKSFAQRNAVTSDDVSLYVIRLMTIMDNQERE
jgi:hypothetical protein